MVLACCSVAASVLACSTPNKWKPPDLGSHFDHFPGKKIKQMRCVWSQSTALQPRSFETEPAQHYRQNDSLPAIHLTWSWTLGCPMPACARGEGWSGAQKMEGDPCTQVCHPPASLSQSPALPSQPHTPTPASFSADLVVAALRLPSGSDPAESQISGRAAWV